MSKPVLEKVQLFLKGKGKLFYIKLALAAVLAVALCVVLWKELDYRRGQSDYDDALALAMSGQPTVAPPPAVSPSDTSVTPSVPDASRPDASAFAPNASSPAPDTSSAAPDASAPAAEPAPAQPAPPPTPRETMATMNLSALQSVNREVVGWIEIPDTILSYPVLQGRDNSFYLTYTWKKSWSSVGSIFLDSQVSGDLSDFNTLIYGHRMRNKSMFGSLGSYKRLSYWREHPSVYIATNSGVYQYDIYAAFEASTQSIIYGLGITDPELKEEFIQFSLDNSVINTGITPTVDDRILTMSTCTGNGYETRWVVLAVLRGETTSS